MPDHTATMSCTQEHRIHAIERAVERMELLIPPRLDSIDRNVGLIQTEIIGTDQKPGVRQRLWVVEQFYATFKAGGFKVGTILFTAAVSNLFGFLSALALMKWTGKL